MGGFSGSFSCWAVKLLFRFCFSNSNHELLFYPQAEKLWQFLRTTVISQNFEQDYVLHDPFSWLQLSGCEWTRSLCPACSHIKYSKTMLGYLFGFSNLWLGFIEDEVSCPIFQVSNHTPHLPRLFQRCWKIPYHRLPASIFWLWVSLEALGLTFKSALWNTTCRRLLTFSESISAIKLVSFVPGTREADRGC